jgi:ribonuclease E
MSRQRIRASMLESSTESCPHCGGTGHVRSVPSVALQLLRSLEETLMKGATHNLIVRTRTNVALYVLNQKRGHLRDLEHSFKVGLSVIADPAIAGQQSFIIDRGEQVHTLEAAKALLTAQLAAFPPQPEEAAEDEQPLDTEAETETGDTEVRTDEQAVSEAEGDGRKRKRRRSRRERSVEIRDDQIAPDDDTDNVLIPADFAAARFMTDDVENDGDDAGVQDPEAQADQSPDGERRPRRRGRRGGRRRRGSTGAGLAGSISDELGPTSDSEVVEAVADFDSAPIAPEPEPQVGSPDVEVQPQNSAGQPDIASPDDGKDQAISESEKTVRRRSTVREKVSFTSEEAPPVAPAAQSQPEETAPEPQQPQEESNEDRPRRAGWWSRRFGNGG